MEDFDFPELTSVEIPDKRHFKIGEVAKLLDLEPYVLRYWEKEFDILNPSKTDSGQRAYQKNDIRLLATIQRLLYTEMFTIDGACRQLELAREGEPSYLTSTMGEASEAEATADSEALEEAQWENEQLRLELEQAEATFADRRRELESRIGRLEDALEDARARQDDGERVAALKERIADLEESNRQLQSKLDQTRSELEELEDEKRQLEESNERVAAADREVVEALHGQVEALADIGDATSSA